MKIGPFFNRRSKPAPQPAEAAQPKRPVSVTYTMELTQPVRLHYKVLDAKGAAESLQRLKCIETVAPGKAYNWYLTEETAGAFKVNHSLPKGEEVILGNILLNPKPRGSPSSFAASSGRGLPSSFSISM